MVYSSGLREYAGRQRQLATDADRLASLHSARSEKGLQLAIVYECLMGLTNDECRIRDCNQRSSGIVPANGKTSTDPVYRKISLADGNLNKYDRYGIALSIRDHITDLQIKMERRQMTEPEYLHILETPEIQLIEEWSEPIIERLGLRRSA